MAKQFVRFLLNPDPQCRLTVYQAIIHPWVTCEVVQPSTASITCTGRQQVNDTVTPSKSMVSSENLGTECNFKCDEGQNMERKVSPATNTGRKRKRQDEQKCEMYSRKKNRDVLPLMQVESNTPVTRSSTRKAAEQLALLKFTSSRPSSGDEVFKGVPTPPTQTANKKMQRKHRPQDENDDVVNDWDDESSASYVNNGKRTMFGFFKSCESLANNMPWSR